MSIAVSNWAWQIKGLTMAERIVLVKIADHCHDDGSEGRPGRARLAEACCTSEKTITRTLKSLVEKGHLAVQRRHGQHKTTVYRFTFKGVDELPTGVSDGTFEDYDENPDGTFEISDGTFETSRRDTDVPITIKNHQPKHHSSSSRVKTPDGDKMPQSYLDSPFREDAERLCKVLAELMVRNGVRKPNITKSWLRDMDLLMRVDERTPADVEMVLRWSQNDGFWYSNILSPKKFREKFDTLLLSMLKTPKASRPDPLAKFRGGN